MFVLGFGLGMVMQVLTIVVQNAVQYRDLGAATSGVTFFRSIGSSFGVAVFGSIFSNELAINISRYLSKSILPSGVSLATLHSTATPTVADRRAHRVRPRIRHSPSTCVFRRWLHRNCRIPARMANTGSCLEGHDACDRPRQDIRDAD
jgi:hypothetical protein